MRKLAYIFGIALFLFGCAGGQSLSDHREELVRKNPNNADAHRDLGIAYLYSSHYHKAIASFKEAIRIKPEFSQYYHLGNAYKELGKYGGPTEELGRYKKAVSAYKEVIRLKSQVLPNDLIRLHTDLADVYQRMGRNTEAIAEYKEVIGIKADNEYIHTNLGLAYESEGQYKEAIASYNEALRIKPSYAFARLQLNKLKKRIAQPTPAPPVRQATPQPSEKKLIAGGTGFLFSSRDYIITNWHVVKGAGSIEVKFPGGEAIKAKVLAKDSQNDIAVLKLSQSPSTQIPDLNFGDSSKVRPGDKVFTIGYPASSILGKNQKITDGIVSSITGIEDDPTMFQITVPIQPGNSGGPLFNESGEVIGITTASLSLNAIRSLGAVPQNVNYAIKSSFVNNLLTTIPKTLLSNRGIVVVPSKPGNSLADFFERVSNNIVLIEAKE
jgi:S1-C subfamily serine protease